MTIQPDHNVLCAMHKLRTFIKTRQMWFTNYTTQIVNKNWFLWTSEPTWGVRWGKQPPQSLRFFGDARFYRMGHANSENIRFLKLIHTAPLHDVNVGWCVVCSYDCNYDYWDRSVWDHKLKSISMTHFDTTFWQPVRLRQKSMPLVCKIMQQLTSQAIPYVF